MNPLHQFQRWMKERERAFIKQVSALMNEEILGSMESKGQWNMPIETQRGESMKVGTINIENYCGHKIMENLFTGG